MSVAKSSKYKYIFCKYITEISRWRYSVSQGSASCFLGFPSGGECLRAGWQLSWDTAEGLPALPQAAAPHWGCMLEPVSVCTDLWSETRRKSWQPAQPFALLGASRKTCLHSLQLLGFIQAQLHCCCLSTPVVPDNILIFYGGITRVFAWYLLCQAISS